MDAHRAVVAWYVVLLVMTALVLLVRGPLREETWGDDCYALTHGSAIQATESNQTILEICNDLTPRRSTT